MTHHTYRPRLQKFRFSLSDTSFRVRFHRLDAKKSDEDHDQLYVCRWRETCPSVDTRFSHDRRQPDVSFSLRQLCKSSLASQSFVDRLLLMNGAREIVQSSYHLRINAISHMQSTLKVFLPLFIYYHWILYFITLRRSFIGISYECKL